MEGDEVTIDDKPLIEKPELIYIALNKPPGITSTTDLKDPDNIIDFIGHEKRIFPIGRLDKPSSGLILLTNDGGYCQPDIAGGKQPPKGIHRSGEQTH